MRPLWIATCVLAVVGGFFVVLQTSWMLKLEPEWLPYLAHPLGALLAGWALCHIASASRREAFIGGVLAVALLAFVTYVLPHAFTLTAARSPHALILVPVVAIVSGLGCVLGARVPAAANRMRLPIVTALVAACVFQLGGRLAYTFGLPATPVALAVFSIVAAAATGALLQALAGGNSERGVAIGVLVMLLWGVLKQVVLSSTSVPTFWDMVTFVGAPLGAALGARFVRRQ